MPNRKQHHGKPSLPASQRRIIARDLILGDKASALASATLRTVERYRVSYKPLVSECDDDGCTCDGESNLVCCSHQHGLVVRLWYFADDCAWAVDGPMPDNAGESLVAHGFGLWEIPMMEFNVDDQLVAAEEYARRVRFLSDDLMVDALRRMVFFEWAFGRRPID